MKVKAMETMKNGYDQVLFLEGHEYEGEQNGKVFLILNELHTETPLTERALKKSFEILEADPEITLIQGKKYWCWWMSRYLWYKGKSYNGKDDDFEDTSGLVVTLGSFEIEQLKRR